MKFLFKGIIIVFIIILISACSNKKEVIKLKNRNFSSTLMIQKTEDNASSEKLKKIVRDKQKIEKILEMIEGLEVKEIDSNKVFEEMKKQNYYFFSFAKGEKFKSGKPVPYTFIALNDGTFIFTYKDVDSPQQPRVTIVKHKKLLNGMKQLLEVDF